MTAFLFERRRVKTKKKKLVGAGRVHALSQWLALGIQRNCSNLHLASHCLLKDFLCTLSLPKILHLLSQKIIDYLFSSFARQEISNAFATCKHLPLDNCLDLKDLRLLFPHKTGATHSHGLENIAMVR